MSDLIRREETLIRIRECYPSPPIFERNRKAWLKDYEGYIRAYEIIKAIPTAEPKVGKWIKKDGMWCDDPTFRCSVCGEEYELLEGTPIDNGMNYCPNCGSRMFERSNDERDNE